MQNGGQVLACPPSANIRLYGSSIPHPKGKQRFYIFKYASRNPGIWAAKNPDKIGVFAEHIFFMFLLWRRRRDSNSRTLLRVTRFPVARPRPTRRLLQVVRVQSVLCCFHKQPLYNSMSDGKNQDIFQKKMNFFVSPRKAAKRAGFPPFSYAAMLNLPSHTRRHASPVHLPAVALFLVLGKRLDFTAEGRMRNFFRKQFVV